MMNLFIVACLVAVWAVITAWSLRGSFLLLFVLYGTVFLKLGVPLGSQETFISLVDVLFVVFCVAVGYRVWKSSQFVFPRDRFLFGGIGFFFSIVLVLPYGYVLSQNPSVSALTPGIRHLQYFLFFPIAILLSRTGRLSERDLLAVLCVMVSAHFVYMVLQLLTVHYPGVVALEWLYIDEYHRPTGLFWDPIRLGFHFAFVGLLTTPYVVRGDHDRQWAYTGLVMMCLAGILLSEGRGSLVAYLVPVGVLVGVSVESAELRRFLPVVVVVLGIFGLELVVGTPLGLVDRFGTIIAVVTEGPASVMSGRFSHWGVALEQYRDVGFWGGGVTAREFGILTDNYYLVLLIQAGPLGVLSVLLMYLGIFRFSLRQYLQTKTLYGLGLCLAVVGLAISNITYNSLGFHDIQILLWTVLGVVAAEGID